MPVRRIGLCYRSVSGRVPMGPGRPGVVVESTLERDFALLQRFNPEVASIEEQPVRIEYRGADGVRRKYVPDFLVSYRNFVRPQNLVEVKFSNDPALLSGGLEERFTAARTYAGSRGWLFEVTTEIVIRTPRLGNATFLLPFRNRDPDPGLRSRLLIALQAGASSVEALVNHVAGGVGGHRAAVLPTLWGMVARFEVSADLDRSLTMRSLLSLPEGGR